MDAKVKNQFEHAMSLDDTISKFNMLWISFNCYYNTEKFRGKNQRDSESINILKQDEDCVTAFGNLEKDVFYKFINERETSFLDNEGVYNLRNNQKRTYKNIGTFGEYLEIIYTIRNNQFHGSKDPKDELDNELLEHATQSFENFLSELYKIETTKEQ